MNYLGWNAAIGEFFFNPKKAEQEVYLFITKDEIITIGRSNGLDGRGEDIFDNFITAMRSGIPGTSRNNILDFALYSYKRWKSIDDHERAYPLYLAYLALFVLPLTEGYDGNLRIDAYYPRIRSFLAKNDLPHLPSQNGHYNWNSLWTDLEEWSILEKNEELGYFDPHSFTNERWVYVGKPLSQSIFPAYAIQKLPQFFGCVGFVPGENISEDVLKQAVLRYGPAQLSLTGKVLNTIQDTDNELGQSILKIIHKNYQEWTGNTDQYDSGSNTVKKGFTIAQLRLCIEGDDARGYRTRYRLYTKQDYPDDLTFATNDQVYPCTVAGRGWSKPLSISFQEDLVLEDKLNKWRAKLPVKGIRLLADGKTFHLSGWVEVPHISYSKMRLLVKEESSPSVEEWGSCFQDGDFKKLRFAGTGLPEGYKLYEFINPPISHPDIPALQFKTDRKLVVTGGLKTGVRTWYNEMLPEIEIENGRGTEGIYITYDGDDAKIPLERKGNGQSIWSLPKDIQTDRDFYIKANGLEIVGDQFRNRVVEAKRKLDELSQDALPPRDEFGRVVGREENETYVVGSRLCANSEDRALRLRQVKYNSYFQPANLGEMDLETNQGEMDSINELLLNFLTVKGASNVKDYFEAFENVYYKAFSSQETEATSLPLSLLKRGTINYMDYMGFLDYEYTTKKIVVNPPEFILIPTRSGRKVILIGGRTPELIDKLTDEIKESGLQLAYRKQDPSLSPFLLPTTISVSGQGKGVVIEKEVDRIAKACGIAFDSYRHPQVRLVEFSGSIDKYDETLVESLNFDDQGWITKSFDHTELRFVPVDREQVDKSYALVEYKLNEYTFIHKLWKDGIPYNVNKNWGRYMILRYHNRQVIFSDPDNMMVAIPASFPLPRLLSEAMTLLSGQAPKRLEMRLGGINTWFNIYQNIPAVFAYNSFRKVGQQTQEIKIDL